MPHLVAIFITPEAGGTPISVTTAHFEAGRGIVGDRYHAGAGTFSRWPGEGRAVSFIEDETLQAIRDETGLDLSAGQHRRNLVTCGVELASLIGKTFRLGPPGGDGPLLRGTRECTECIRPDRLTGLPIKAALRGRPGLRADIVEGGAARIGAPLT